MPEIEIDGQKCEVDGQKMIIEVADELGVDIPRFCYHKKLSVAANCRMCLVEVERAPKALPACATPVTDGMKVFTKSPAALAAQKAVMEFLLINHPLDCPICDQGGECELQDVSVGYGNDVSRYTERKRVVEDENLGSLISTDMTRCIHCTRCVRFGEEIAGVRELGATGRGESMRIGTYVEHSMSSEVSGNIIDLCPVGALTSKPYRYTARAWELTQHDGVAPHDCLGSNVNLHTRRGEVMRVLPKENESINETWLSDRDRFSYTALTHSDRVTEPMVKRNGEWQVVTWETALITAIKQLQTIKQSQGAEKIGALASSTSTTEELYLLQKFMRGFGSNNIDHRLQMSDFSDQAHMPLFPGMDMPFAGLENKKTIILIGSDIQREQPLAALRIRKAVANGARVVVINPREITFSFDTTLNIPVSTQDLTCFLAAIIKSMDAKLTDAEKIFVANAEVNDDTQTIANLLNDGGDAIVLFGAIAQNHYQSSYLRALSQVLVRATHSGEFAEMTAGSNSAGAWLAGALPHRGAAGEAITSPGLDAYSMLRSGLSAYVLLGVEPEFDSANAALAKQHLSQAESVIALTAFTSEAMLDYADVILPIAAFAETSGTTVNLNGVWQSAKGAATPRGESRPAWKVLRVMGNIARLDGFDFDDSTQVRDELAAALDNSSFTDPEHYLPQVLPYKEDSLRRVSQWPIYAGDGIVRRADALQRAASNETPCIHVHPDLAKRFNLRNGKSAQAVQGSCEATLDVLIDPSVAPNTVYIPSGCEATANLGDAFGEITLK